MDSARKKEYMKKYHATHAKEKRKARRTWWLNNKAESNRRVREWQRANKPRVRNTALKTRFGITLEQYNEMLLKQNNVCAICGFQTVRALAVDHDHKNNKIRGLLCHNCNIGLGLFRDNPIFLTNAINYLVNK